MDATDPAFRSGAYGLDDSPIDLATSSRAIDSRRSPANRHHRSRGKGHRVYENNSAATPGRSNFCRRGKCGSRGHQDGRSGVSIAPGVPDNGHHALGNTPFYMYFQQAGDRRDDQNISDACHPERQRDSVVDGR